METMYKIGDKLEQVKQGNGMPSDIGDITTVESVDEGGCYFEEYAGYYTNDYLAENYKLVSPELDAITTQKAVIAEEQRKLAKMFKQAEIDERMLNKTLVIESTYGGEYTDEINDKLSAFQEQFRHGDKLRVTMEYIGE